MFEVTLKQGHPTGTRHRDGRTFSVNDAVQLETISDAIKNDSWLVVTEIDPSKVLQSAASAASAEDPAPLLELLGAENVAQGVAAVQFHIESDEQIQNEMATLRTDLGERDRHIGELESAALSNGNTIHTLESQMKERDEKIAEMEKAAADGEGKGKGRGRS